MTRPPRQSNDAKALSLAVNCGKGHAEMRLARRLEASTRLPSPFPATPVPQAARSGPTTPEMLAGLRAIDPEADRLPVVTGTAQIRAGTYRLRTALMLGGDLSDADRATLLAAAQKGPVHRLMTDFTIEIDTVLVDS